jgi:hypothetical protein
MISDPSGYLCVWVILRMNDSTYSYAQTCKNLGILLGVELASKEN